jgi:putative membrane protein
VAEVSLLAKALKPCPDLHHSDPRARTKDRAAMAPGLWRRPPAGAILQRMKLLLNWLLSAAALLAVAYLYSGVVVTSFTGALIAAAVLGALNLVVRPILVILTLPVTLVTLGLFLFIVNALMFWAAASLVSGLSVTGFGAALIGSLLYSLLQLAIDFVLQRLRLNQ